MGKLIVISGPSGSGKTTICNRLLKIFSELAYSVSATTRKRREGEKEGIDYYFVSRNKFEEMINDNEFIEWENVHGNLYGTLFKDIERKRDKNLGVLMDIDPKGGMNIKKKYPASILIFLSVPSIDVLIERLKKRKTEKDIDISKRTERTKEEFELSKNYDYIIENNNIKDTLKKISEIIKKKVLFNKEYVKR